jgi:phosphonate transport system substrate-binding protein
VPSTSAASAYQNPSSNYKDSSSDTGYSLKNIKGKRMSFVSQSSTSGFKVPCDAIMKAFPDDVKSTDDLATPGFFSEVLFGNSHPGSCVNLLQGDADVAAFDDIDVDSYLVVPRADREKVNAPGNVYSVKKDAAQPFDRVKGKKFGIIHDAGPERPDRLQRRRRCPMTSARSCSTASPQSECSQRRAALRPEGKEGNGAIWSKEDSAGFIAVEDSWYDPIRKLSE